MSGNATVLDRLTRSSERELCTQPCVAADHVAMTLRVNGELWPALWPRSCVTGQSLGNCQLCVCRRTFVGTSGTEPQSWSDARRLPSLCLRGELLPQRQKREKRPETPSRPC